MKTYGEIAHGVTRIETSECPVCHKTTLMDISSTGLWKWQQEGRFIQDAFPELDAEAREMILTGTHQQCWDALFPDEEEDDWDPNYGD